MDSEEADYHFVVLDARKSDNPKIDFGIEITIPELLPEGVTNLDHHNENRHLPAAIEQALSCDLPAPGSVIGTVRPDMDSIGAMAVLQLRLKKRPIPIDYINRIALVDKREVTSIWRWKNMHQNGRLNQRVVDQGVQIPLEIVLDKYLDLRSKVCAMALWLTDGIAMKQHIAAAVLRQEKRARSAEEAVSNAIDCGGGVALVKRALGQRVNLTGIYRKVAQVIVSYSDVHLERFSRKFKIFCRKGVALDWNGLVSDLNAAELSRGGKPDWGGHECLIASPRYVDSVLGPEQVVDFVKNRVAI